MRRKQPKTKGLGGRQRARPRATRTGPEAGGAVGARGLWAPDPPGPHSSHVCPQPAKPQARARPTLRLAQTPGCRPVLRRGGARGGQAPSSCTEVTASAGRSPQAQLRTRRTGPGQAQEQASGWPTPGRARGESISSAAAPSSSPWPRGPKRLPEPRCVQAKRLTPWRQRPRGPGLQGKQEGPGGAGTAGRKPGPDPAN